MKKKKIIVTIILALCIFSTLVYFLMFSSEGIQPQDIDIHGQLAQNDSETLVYKKYIIEFTITKRKSGTAMVYPYAEGLINPTFEETEGTKVGGVGTGGDGYESVIDGLKKNKVLSTNESIDVWGFNCPKEPGAYSFKVYYDKLEGKQIPEQAYITYLNLEDKYGIHNYLTKIETIKMIK